MLIEVPSIKANFGATVEVVKSELNSEEVYFYPLTDTLVFAYDHEPTDEELFFPVAVRKAIEKGRKGVYLFLDFATSTVHAVIFGDRGTKKHVLPLTAEAVASIVHEAKKVVTEEGGGVYFLFRGGSEEEVRNLLREAVNISGVLPKGGVNKLNVSVTEEDRKHLLTEISLRDKLRQYWKKTRENPAFYKALKWSAVFIAFFAAMKAVFWGYGYYKKVQAERARKQAMLQSLEKAKQKKKLIPYFTVNAGLYKVLNEDAPLFFSFSTIERKAVELVKDRRNDARWTVGNYSVVEKKVFPVKIKPCSLKGVFWEEGNRNAFSFNGTLLDLQNKVLCLNLPLRITGIKTSSKTYLFTVEKETGEKNGKKNAGRKVLSPVKFR